MSTPTLPGPARARRRGPAPAAPQRVAGGAFDPRQLLTSLPDAVRKAHPRHLVRTPVVFVVFLGAALTTVLAVLDPSVFAWTVVGWLWLTVLFATLAEAVAEGRGRAQAASLRSLSAATTARRLREGSDPADVAAPQELVPSGDLRVGDLVVVEAGQTVPGDGDVVHGAASVDESAVTGESAPVVREAGGDRTSVTGGTTVLSDRVVVVITAEPGKSFVDRMVALVEGSARRRTPNETALATLLTSLTLVLLLAVVTLQPMAAYSGRPQPTVVLVALLVCLIPTTVGALLSAVGIAGMDRLVQRNVLATSGRAVEAAGDVGTLLLDKTGTVTLGNRQARELLPAPGVEPAELAAAALLSSLSDATPEGRSVVALVEERHGLRADDPALGGTGGADPVPFTARTRMSGVDLPGRRVRKGAASAAGRWVRSLGGDVPPEVDRVVEEVATSGGTPLVVAEERDGRARVLGVVQLEDVVKEGVRERFAQLRAMGIRTVMVTGDNARTAAAVAAEAGVDDVLAEATPEDKLALIRREQAGGRLVAMTGDGTNDAPALAQADVGVAMGTGTSAAKEAATMVDLDSDPTKLVEVVQIGKQLLITRGALTTFSIANDVAKYFAVLPAMFATTYPQLGRLDVMRLHSPESAVVSAVVFNAVVIVALVPLALRGVRYRPGSAASLLRRNLLVYGLGGVLVPFAGIKLIDLLVSTVPGIG